MAKKIELGVVSKIHSSGIVETDKGKKTYIEAKHGDRLVKDPITGEITIASKKTTETPAQKKKRLADEEKLKGAVSATLLGQDESGASATETKRLEDETNEETK